MGGGETQGFRSCWVCLIDIFKKLEKSKHTNTQQQVSDPDSARMDTQGLKCFACLVFSSFVCF